MCWYLQATATVYMHWWQRNVRTNSSSYVHSHDTGSTYIWSCSSHCRVKRPIRPVHCLNATPAEGREEKVERHTPLVQQRTDRAKEWGGWGVFIGRIAVLAPIRKRANPFFGCQPKKRISSWIFSSISDSSFLTWNTWNIQLHNHEKNNINTNFIISKNRPPCAPYTCPSSSILLFPIPRLFLHTTTTFRTPFFWNR